MFDYDVVLTGAGLTEEQARQRYDDAVRVCPGKDKG
jgi:hypothetical protein